jgi:hypothetical protein
MNDPQYTVHLDFYDETFHELLIDEATEAIYTNILPVLEGQGIFLSHFGNHNCVPQDEEQTMRNYYKMKADKKLFDVPKVQAVFQYVDTHYDQSGSGGGAGTYALKHEVEAILGSYVTNGDAALGFILAGFKVRFIFDKQLSLNGHVSVMRKARNCSSFLSEEEY